MFVDDTISAVATALGEGAIGIIRLSGPRSCEIADRIFQAASGKRLEKYPPNTLVYGHIKDAEGIVVDEALVVFMRSPRSYTAENVVEIQSHGGIQSLKKILSLTYEAGARPAEPGEFTKRAFLNGRIDLAQAEAVMDIIKARSEVSLKLALRQQQGQLSREIGFLRKRLLNIIVNLEAVIDYPEEDIEEVTFQNVKNTIDDVQSEISLLLNNAHTGKIMREGMKTVIIGRPNVGKSSLLNSLLKEERAIVSEIPGTTRDVIEEQLLIDGIPLVLTDTAGIRNTDDYVEKIGVEKTKKILEEAELAIVVLDGSESLRTEDIEILQAVKEKPYVIIVNKGDLPQALDLSSLERDFGADNIMQLSAMTSAGVDNFIAWLKKYVYGNGGQLEDGIYVQNTRHEYLLKKALSSLEEALAAAKAHVPYDCIIIDLRNAVEAIGFITGDTVSDEIINEIFARFCVGK
ncbi:MAG: tRNA uridine-5-carboxymethylaminomethyl(34) synthesis GTPase MnmE [Acidaminococcaceae bacterium]